MELLKRILLIVAGFSIIILIVALAASIFIVVWPIVAVAFLALVIYTMIRNKILFGKTPPQSDFRKEERHQTTIIIEHQEGEIDEPGDEQK